MGYKEYFRRYDKEADRVLLEQRLYLPEMAALLLIKERLHLFLHYKKCKNYIQLLPAEPLAEDIFRRRPLRQFGPGLNRLPPVAPG